MYLVFKDAVDVKAEAVGNYFAIGSDVKHHDLGLRRHISCDRKVENAIDEVHPAGTYNITL